MSNMHIVQRKHAIPHSTMKNNHNVIQCCNNTCQGAPYAGKRTLVLWTSVTLVTLLVCKDDKIVDMLWKIFIALDI